MEKRTAEDARLDARKKKSPGQKKKKPWRAACGIKEGGGCGRHNAMEKKNLALGGLHANQKRHGVIG